MTTNVDQGFSTNQKFQPKNVTNQKTAGTECHSTVEAPIYRGGMPGADDRDKVGSRGKPAYRGTAGFGVPRSRGTAVHRGHAESSRF